MTPPPGDYYIYNVKLNKYLAPFGSHGQVVSDGRQAGKWTLARTGKTGQSDNLWLLYSSNSGRTVYITYQWHNKPHPPQFELAIVRDLCNIAPWPSEIPDTYFIGWRATQAGRELNTCGFSDGSVRVIYGADSSQAQYWKFITNLSEDNQVGPPVDTGNGNQGNGNQGNGGQVTKPPNNGGTSTIDPGLLDLLKGINSTQLANAEAAKADNDRKLQDAKTRSDLVNGILGALGLKNNGGGQ
ncbi:hypothetical protein SISNIDRAFT_450520 [Sistotremastrum niveocremeum HHB9708]|uniref:Uncharacterized protein n=1 Tax=Sistotremastrum niveocremeum HHB9708 TaxID=1314777 RepID=A0A164YC99_9AGAM|nr:hypothetical protein SISNIDRAFT_450520 [Sistotremastrum niveocremeum HHB9708]